MPLEVDRLRTAVTGNNQTGYLELKKDGTKICKYGDSFFGHKFGWFPKRSDETNKNVREQVFRALAAPGKCQAEMLERVRNMLGINQEGRAENSTPLEVRTVRQILDEVDHSNANLRERQGLVDTLAREGMFIHSGMKEEVETLLGLPSSPSRLQPLTPQLTEQIRQRATQLRDNYLGILKHKFLGTFDDNALLAMVPTTSPHHASLQQAIAEAKNENGVHEIAIRINRYRIDQLTQNWTSKLNDRIKSFKEMSGLDMSQSIDDLFDKFTSSVRSTVNGATTAEVRSEEELTDAFNKVMNKFFVGKEAMVNEVERHGDKLTPGAKNLAKEFIRTDLFFKNVGALSVMLDNVEIGQESMYEKAFDLPTRKNITQDEVMKAYGDFRAGFTKFTTDVKSKTANYTLDPGESADFGEKFYEISKQAYLDKHNLTQLPPENKQLKQLLRNYSDKQSYLLALARQNKIQERYPNFITSKITEMVFRSETDAMQDFSFCVGFNRENNVEDFDTDYDALVLDSTKPAPELSKAEIEHLNKYCYVGIHHDSYENEEISQYLSGAFDADFNDGLKNDVALGMKSTVDDPTVNWSQTVMDLSRPAIGLSLNGTSVMRPYEACGYDLEEHKVLGRKIGDYFREDKEHGVEAERILSRVLQQSIFANIQISMLNSKDPFSDPLQSHAYSLADISITRDANGSYLIEAKTVVAPQMACVTVKDPVTGRENMEERMLSNSHLDMTINLKLDFPPNGKAPKLYLSQATKVTGKISQAPVSKQTLKDKVMSLKLEDGSTGEFLRDNVLATPEVCNDPKFLELVNGKDTEQLKAYLSSNLITHQDMGLMVMMGFKESCLKLALYRTDGDKITKKMINQLIHGATPNERNEAKMQMQRILDDMAAKQQIAESAVLDDTFVPLLSTNVVFQKASTYSSSDFTLTINYIKNHHKEDILERLRSSDKAIVQAAENELKELVLAARKEQGLELLRLQYKFLPEDVERLKVSYDKGSFDGLMDHIARRDVFFDESLQTLREVLAVTPKNG